ncbi:hypothetical protein OROHE_009129 [Orobanche hederae]
MSPVVETGYVLGFSRTVRNIREVLRLFISKMLLGMSLPLDWAMFLRLGKVLSRGFLFLRANVSSF